jgi:hypothetical protein
MDFVDRGMKLGKMEFLHQLHNCKLLKKYLYRLTHIQNFS